MLDTIGWVYTLHLHQRLGREGRNSAQHYTGWCERWRLEARLTDHRLGNERAAAITRWCAAQRIGWHVGGLELGTPADERRLKQHGAARRCWTCRARAQAQPPEPYPFPEPFPRLSPAFMASLAVQIPAFLLPF